MTTWVKKSEMKIQNAPYTSHLTAWVYLFMPLQQYGTAIFYRPLKAFVDILHEKIDSILVERFNSRLYIAAPKWCQHPQYHSLSSFLREWKDGVFQAVVQSVLCILHSEKKFLLKRSVYLYCWVLAVDWRVPKSNMKGCHHVPCALELVMEDNQ